jgi:hypothetical protein
LFKKRDDDDECQGKGESLSEEKNVWCVMLCQDGWTGKKRRSSGGKDVKTSSGVSAILSVFLRFLLSFRIAERKREKRRVNDENDVRKAEERRGTQTDVKMIIHTSFPSPGNQVKTKAPSSQPSHNERPRDLKETDETNVLTWSFLE